MKDVVREKFNLKSGLVINATGVFADDISRMDNPSARQTIKPSQGVHVVLDKSFIYEAIRTMIPKTSDDVFSLSFHVGDHVVGTTYTPLDKNKSRTCASGKRD
ncbi:MAG: hypothetical protein MZU84_02330 [Sphingobacterium sp.]|nr:hypothetical protein [Sphingobacterium sp.]